MERVLVMTEMRPVFSDEAQLPGKMIVKTELLTYHFYRVSLILCEVVAGFGCTGEGETQLENTFAFGYS